MHVCMCACVCVFACTSCLSETAALVNTWSPFARRNLNNCSRRHVVILWVFGRCSSSLRMGEFPLSGKPFGCSVADLGIFMPAIPLEKEPVEIEFGQRSKSSPFLHVNSDQRPPSSPPPTPSTFLERKSGLFCSSAFSYKMGFFGLK